MYRLEYTTNFKKDLKTCKKRGLELHLLQRVIDILQETGTLPNQYRPHKLSGKFEGLWECHIKSDWLLNMATKRYRTGLDHDRYWYACRLVLSHQRLCLIRFINSSRVLACWKKPVKSEVVVKEFCFSTPRICIQHMLRLDHDHHAQTGPRSSGCNP